MLRHCCMCQNGIACLRFGNKLKLGSVFCTTIDRVASKVGVFYDRIKRDCLAYNFKMDRLQRNSIGLSLIGKLDF